MRGSDCSIEKLFEDHRISHHPTKHKITPYNSSDAGLTATLLLLLATTQCGTSCSPPASSAYRHPMAAVRVIDDVFATPLLKHLLLSCALFGDSNATTATMKRMRASRAPKERFARGKGATKTCLNTASSSLQTSRTHEQDTMQFGTGFRLPYSRVSNAPRKSVQVKKKQKLQTRSDRRQGRYPDTSRRINNGSEIDLFDPPNPTA